MAEVQGVTTTRTRLLRDVLGEQLRRVRHDQGRTLADVAATAALSLAYLSEVERGRKEISSEVLAALCEALGIGLADLLAMIRDAMRPVAPDRAVITLATRSRPVGGRGDRGRIGGSVASPQLRAA